MPSRVLLCPHCSNETPHKLVLNHTFKPTWYGSDGKPSKGPQAPITHLGYLCSTCNDISLYCIVDNQEETLQLEYPQSHVLESGVPTAVRKTYAEAKLLQKRSPNAFAVMIRRSLEALCDDKKIAKGTLQKRLKMLADTNVIPPVLADMSTSLRLLGNAGAHHTEKDITVPQTWKIDKLFRAIIEYVYIAPKLLADFQETNKQTEQGAAANP